MSGLTSGERKSGKGGAATVGFPSTNPPQRKQRTYDFSFATGATIGDDLVVTDRISAGPFTEIYQVFSESHLCPFACKVLRPSIDDESAVARSIEREKRVLKRISHPNVVRVFDDSGEADCQCIVMEYLPGPSLFEMLSTAPKRRLKIDAALRIAIRIGAALEAVHSLGLVYRDLKPSNILMRDGEPVLIDLGSVYNFKPGRAPRERLGTDPYMAPEQCLGRPLSPATDVFGLGAVTYEMITGEWPFEEQLMNVFDRSRIHTRFPQVAYAPGSIRRKVASASEELEATILKCLARKPRDRYATIADAVLELNRCLEADSRVVPESLLGGRAA
jgi:serine/threonine-protein kinase